MDKKKPEVHYATCMVQMPLLMREVDGRKVRTPVDAASICKDMMHLAQESFQVLLLDTKNQLISRVQATLGLVDTSLVHPREIFRAAIQYNASAIVLVHNHPSGDTTPSSEDIRCTKVLLAAGKIIGIEVIDHVIIGHTNEWEVRTTSMRESGLIEF